MTTHWDWSRYTGSLPWVPSHTIFITRHGSHAYGTSVPESDEDFRGVCIPPKEYFLGYRKKFENHVQSDPDLTIFEVRKFMSLCSDMNPNVVELLFTEPSDHLYIHPSMSQILAERDLFLSQRVLHTYIGFAAAQVRKITTHARWLKEAPVRPTRADFGLKEEAEIPRDQLGAALTLVDRQVDAWTDFDYLQPGDLQVLRTKVTKAISEANHWSNPKSDLWETAGKALGFDSNFLEYLAKEKAYRAKEKEYSDYVSHVKGRNGKRSEIESKYGYDTKYALHAVRLVRTAKELLTTGTLQVRRPDASELVSIRNGSWPLEKVMGYVKDMEAELHETPTSLPKSPNLEEIDKLCVSAVQRFLGYGSSISLFCR